MIRAHVPGLFSKCLTECLQSIANVKPTCIVKMRCKKLCVFNTNKYQPISFCINWLESSRRDDSNEWIQKRIKL